jgi:hypothetical protein
VTARCAGATSSGRDTYQRFVYMAPAQIGALLNNVPTPWAVVFAGAIGSLTYDLQTYCASDPPADPGMTAVDWISLLNPLELSAAVLARSKFRDFLGHYFWDTFCKCDDGTIPTPYTPPAAPSDLPAVNNTGVAPTYPTGSPCLVTSTTFHMTPTHFVDRTFSDPIAVPTGSTSVTLTYVPSRHATIGSEEWQINVNCLNSSGAFIGNSANWAEHNGFPQAGTLTAPLTAGTAFIRFACTPTNVQVATDIDVSASVMCGASATPTTPQPCPADPFTQLQLDQLLQLVTLIQRQAAPFAYVPGGVHSGLSGAGHLSVQGLLGAKVVLDATGSSVGFLSGDPAEVYAAGWITWGNADGSSHRQFITHSPFVSLPALAGQYTRLGYTLGDGVSATITELVREP